MHGKSKKINKNKNLLDAEDAKACYVTGALWCGGKWKTKMKGFWRCVGTDGFGLRLPCRWWLKRDIIFIPLWNIFSPWPVTYWWHSFHLSQALWMWTHDYCVLSWKGQIYILPFSTKGSRAHRGSALADISPVTPSTLTWAQAEKTALLKLTSCWGTQAQSTTGGPGMALCYTLKVLYYVKFT